MASTALAWLRKFLFANQFDTVEVAFLDGRDEPSIERVDQYDVLGVSCVVWIDCVDG